MFADADVDLYGDGRLQQQYQLRTSDLVERGHHSTDHHLPNEHDHHVWSDQHELYWHGDRD
jgi:hypothetical protein